MDFAIENSAEQSAFREEVRAWLKDNVPEGTEFPVDPGDLTLEQYRLRRELGRRLGAQGWLYPNMPASVWPPRNITASGWKAHWG